MEIRAVKEKQPELRFKKEAEVAIHKENPVAAGKDRPVICLKTQGTNFFGNTPQRNPENDGSQEESGKDSGQNLSQGRRTNDSKRNPFHEYNRIYAQGLMAKAAMEGKLPIRNSRIKEADSSKKAKTQQKNKPDHHSGNGDLNQQTRNTGGSHAAANAQAKEKYRKEMKIKALSGDVKIRSGKTDALLSGVKKTGTSAAQNESRTEAQETFAAVGSRADSRRASSGDSGYQPEDQKGKRREKKAAEKRNVLRKKPKNKDKSTKRKKQSQAIRERKLQYMVNKLSGSEEQDSLWQMAKDMIRMKASSAAVKAAQYLGALLAPLSGIVFLAAFPVVLTVVLLYCSPIAAFMENPSDDTPSIQEVLGGYYMEFNQAVSANAGENGTVTYLHEKEGNYVSNYMDTLMVYMVRYGTGDLGVIMDEKHQRLLKEVFDEMNRFEDQTVTTAVQAGKSLGNVVTSAYCSCSICCGQWAGGPTASGAMPKVGHTIAVDAADPFVPMGTRIVMGGKEYVVEDTGAFARYGVQFDIYFDSHEAASRWGHVTMEAFLAEGNENTVSVTKKGSYVKNLNFEDYISLGKLDKAQEELLREVMDAEFRSEIPSSGAGSDAANLALTKVGCQYSQERRYEEGYYDCSSLVQRCYAQFGVNLPAIASTQGQYMVEHGLEVTEDILEPGDVIFYSYENNGQFRNISHVAIYIGNGRMVHASSPERGVVNDPFSPSNVGLYGRPGRGK